MSSTTVPWIKDIVASDSYPGREISWDDFGRMLMTFEGWQFKLEIGDPSDEV